jgi:hypothetical protein
VIASARPSGLSPHHPFWTGFGRSFFLPAAQKIWTLKRQDQFSQGIQGPPELPRIAAQGTGQRQGIDKLLGEWGTRARSTSRPDPRLLVIARAGRRLSLLATGRSQAAKVGEKGVRIAFAALCFAWISAVPRRSVSIPRCIHRCR